MSIKVSIVEDKAGVRKSLAVLINGSSGFECISTFPNAEVALQEMPENWPDVVLMDINLPEMSGIDCAKKLKEIRPTLQIIMLTVYVEHEKIFKSLMAGASGYLIKDTPPTEILEAIADVQRGGSPMSSQIARRVVEHVQQQYREKSLKRVSFPPALSLHSLCRRSSLLQHDHPISRTRRFNCAGSNVCRPDCDRVGRRERFETQKIP